MAHRRIGRGHARRADRRFLLFTTDLDLKPEEVLRTYYQRDEVEKAFRDLNGKYQWALSVSSYQIMSSPYLTVVCHLAYLVRISIAWMLKKAKREESVDQAVEVLRGIYEVNLTKKGVLIPRWTRMSKQQEQLVKFWA